LAVKQTTHEWCRLVNLVEQRYGQAGVEYLFNNWVADPNAAHRECFVPAAAAAPRPLAPSPSPPPNPVVDTSIGPVNDGNNRVVGDWGFTPSNLITINLAGMIRNNPATSGNARSIVGFECALDSSNFRPCTNPFSLAKLDFNATYYFKVRAIDNLGNRDRSPAEFTWFVCPPSKNGSCILSVEFETGRFASIYIPEYRVEELNGPMEHGMLPIQERLILPGLAEQQGIKILKHKQIPELISHYLILF
jgi:hypothetical protein